VRVRELWTLAKGTACAIHDPRCPVGEAEGVGLALNDLPILPQVKLASWSREKPGGWYSTFRRGKKVGSNADMEDGMRENCWELAWVGREGQVLLYKVLGSVPNTE
jgi:hypothetical protein